MDLVGPITPMSLGGSKFFLTAVDTASRYSWVRVLKVKSEAQSILFGIVSIVTTRNTPQNNGMAERMNRTFIEKSRTMIIDAQLPKFLWAEMVVTASFLYNRNLKTCPYKKFWGKEPKLSSIKPVGAELVYSIHHFEPIGKLDARCRKGKLVGFDEELHSYRICDTEGKKIIQSRDVVFEDKARKSGTKEFEAGIESVGIKGIDVPEERNQEEVPLGGGGEFVVKEANREG